MPFSRFNNLQTVAGDLPHGYKTGKNRENVSFAIQAWVLNFFADGAEAIAANNDIKMHAHETPFFP